MSSDADLLQAFIDTRCERAFRTLVERYLSLVYSTAWRQVGDPHRAEDVTQMVFTLLARKAHRLRSHPSLAGWLHTSTYYVAAKTRRAEQRRLRREEEVFIEQSDHDPVSLKSDVEQLRPVIDEALRSLKEADRTAVLLRFFENRTYAEIGARLGLSENTTRMRVDRALDRLQQVLSRRGIRSTAAAFGAALSSQATCAIPVGLAASVLSTALALPASGGLIFIMSTAFLKKSAVAAAALAALTGLFVQQRQIERLKSENKKLAEAAHRSTESAIFPASEINLGPPGLDPATELGRLRAQVEQLKGSSANSWQERVKLLKEVLEQLPEQNIPEIALASNEDWLDAAKDNLETADDYRRALAKLRNLSVKSFITQLRPAVAQYVAAHGSQFPKDVIALQPYLDRKIDEAIWRHYLVTSAATVENVRVGGEFIITQASVVDPTYDQEFVLGLDGQGSSSFGTGSIAALQCAYQKAQGKFCEDPAELMPYATTPRQKAAVSAAIERSQIRQVAQKG